MVLDFVTCARLAPGSPIPRAQISFLFPLYRFQVFIRELRRRGSRTGNCIWAQSVPQVQGYCSWDLFLIFSKCDMFWSMLTSLSPNHLKHVLTSLFLSKFILDVVLSLKNIESSCCLLLMRDPSKLYHILFMYMYVVVLLLYMHYIFHHLCLKYRLHIIW